MNGPSMVMTQFASTASSKPFDVSSTSLFAYITIKIMHITCVKIYLLDNVAITNILRY